MAADEAIWAWKAIKETGSEELNYIIDLITSGHRPGIPAKEEHNENASD